MTSPETTVPMQEMVTLLEGLGMVTRKKAPASPQYGELPLARPGVGAAVTGATPPGQSFLSFEDFKQLYDAAADPRRTTAGSAAEIRTVPHSLSRPRTAGSPPLSRTASGLGGGTLQMRKVLAAEKARKKAEEADRIRQGNAEIRARILAQVAGRDAKALDHDVERMRREAARARAGAKAAERQRIDEENRAFALRKATTPAASVNQLNDEEQLLREHAERARQESRMAKAAADAHHRAQLAMLKSNALAATVNKLSEEEELMRADAAARSRAEFSERATLRAQQSSSLRRLRCFTPPATVNKLSATEEAMRAEAAARARAEKLAARQRLMQQNADLRSRILASGPAIDAALDADANMARELRRQTSAAHFAAEERVHKARAAHLASIRANAIAATDHQLT